MRKQSRTCIVVAKDQQGRIIMAGDRRVSAHWGLAYICPNPKIKKHPHNILVGASGDSSLCKFLLDGFVPSPHDEGTPDDYMYLDYIPTLTENIKLILGCRDGHGLLKFSTSEYCSALFVVSNIVYTLDLYSAGSEESDQGVSRIILDDAPIPYAIGCGAASAMPILLEEFNKKGYNTKATILRAMQIAAEISPGCDANIDFIISKA